MVLTKQIITRPTVCLVRIVTITVTIVIDVQNYCQIRQKMMIVVTINLVRPVEEMLIIGARGLIANNLSIVKMLMITKTINIMIKSSR